MTCGAKLSRMPGGTSGTSGEPPRDDGYLPPRTRPFLDDSGAGRFAPAARSRADGAAPQAVQGLLGASGLDAFCVPLPAALLVVGIPPAESGGMDVSAVSADRFVRAAAVSIVCADFSGGFVGLLRIPRVFLFAARLDFRVYVPDVRRRHCGHADQGPGLLALARA